MKWRVIFDSPRDARHNMAVDEAILRCHAAGAVPPTLRFYTWQPPALSIGYFQKAHAEVDVDACRARGIDFVRRITGGRAVLHDRELTYSVVVREDHPLLPPTLLGSYRILSQGLIAGLHALGVPAEMSLPGAAFGQTARLPKNGACFDAPSFYEITAGRKKLLGSAQVRKEGALLQHGSLLFDFDPSALTSLLKFHDDGERERCEKVLQAKATSLRHILGTVPDTAAVARIMAGEFGRALGLTLEEGRLTAEEEALAERLAVEKFGADSWNFSK
ncbi:biotin/lipoate A/B protein ligase [Thermosinus carboxydivorans Nor1]|uniref:Biotin/lipoate A/B protein ligase n=2 Tax=Thermosinus TaxID=261684 RepID=A1HMF0_9FIRM|nr:biotin/lipoate A/B protein ligase [Thermosinus carboxydivorans Nor1]